MIRSVLVALTVAGLSSGCAGRGGSGPSPLTGFARGLSVEVENENFYSVTIYAYRGGNRFRLGHVESQGTENFDFRWPTGDVQFVIDFLAGGCIVTDPMAVTEGDELLVIVQPADHRQASEALCLRGGT